MACVHTYATLYPPQDCVHLNCCINFIIMNIIKFIKEIFCLLLSLYDIAIVFMYVV